MRETRRHATSYPMNPVIVQPRAAENRAGQVQHNSGDYAIIFKSFYYVVRLDYTYVLCIVSKTADVAASAGFSIGRLKRKDESSQK